MKRDQIEKIIQHAHRFDVRIYWEDTDGEGLVYYANYLKFAERGRTELLRDSGLRQQQLLEKHGLMFVVHHCSITYHAPAILDDILHVYSYFYEIGLSRIRGKQLIIRNDNTFLTDIDITLACLDYKNQRPERIPDDIRQTLQNQIKTIE